MRVPGCLLGLALGVLVGPIALLADEPQGPFGPKAALTSTNGVAYVTFSFQVPREHVLYAERLKFQTPDGESLKPISIPEPVRHQDESSGQEKLVYDSAFSATLKLERPLPMELMIKFQGCSNSACYFPEHHTYKVNASEVVAVGEPPAPAQDQAGTLASISAVNTNGFKIGGRETGFMAKSSFLGFLERAQTGKAGPSDALTRFREVGPMASLFLILLGGLGLNLTPCVLPLVPINLAIIGAGARASSRRRGFALGATYGLGMALVYGVLGLLVVLTGSKFGALNSSPWFNIGIAVVFLVMSLGMFDLINVDFSRFQGHTAGSRRGAQGQYAIALSMGVMAALLAGACVAPVVISVLLLAAQLYGKGMVAGLLLPFLLGLGMAMPWPFAGAGLSFLPKPGKWMKWIKYSFGVMILLFAGYYGHLAYNGLQSGTTLIASARTLDGSASEALASDSALAAALEEGRTQGKPVFIDFAASWCKNCVAMDEAVFPTLDVKRKLADFIVVRYNAEHPNESPARDVLNQFGVIGLPTYVVLLPDKR
jgi:thioredoxin:protein disulfide reductase